MATLTADDIWEKVNRETDEASGFIDAIWGHVSNEVDREKPPDWSKPTASGMILTGPLREKAPPTKPEIIGYREPSPDEEPQGETPKPSVQHRNPGDWLGERARRDAMERASEPTEAMDRAQKEIAREKATKEEFEKAFPGAAFPEIQYRKLRDLYALASRFSGGEDAARAAARAVRSVRPEDVPFFLKAVREMTTPENRPFIDEFVEGFKRGISVITENLETLAGGGIARDGFETYVRAQEARRAADSLQTGGLIRRGLIGMAESLPAMGAAAGVQAATGGIAAPIAAWAAMQAPGYARDYKAAGFSDNEARIAGAVAGTADAAIEMLVSPLDAMLPGLELRNLVTQSFRKNLLKYGKAILRNWTGEMSEEVFQPAAAGIIGDVTAALSRNPNIDYDGMAQFIQQMKQLPETAVAIGGMMAPGAALGAVHVGGATAQARSRANYWRTEGADAFMASFPAEAKQIIDTGQSGRRVKMPDGYDPERGNVFPLGKLIPDEEDRKLLAQGLRWRYEQEVAKHAEEQKRTAGGNGRPDVATDVGAVGAVGAVPVRPNAPEPGAGGAEPQAQVEAAPQSEGRAETPVHEVPHPQGGPAAGKPLVDRRPDIVSAIRRMVARYDALHARDKDIPAGKDAPIVKSLASLHDAFDIAMDPMQYPWVRESIQQAIERVMSSKEIINALQERGPEEVLQRQPGEPGEPGGERGRVESGVQGQEASGAGEQVKPPDENVVEAAHPPGGPAAPEVGGNLALEARRSPEEEAASSPEMPPRPKIGEKLRRVRAFRQQYALPGMEAETERAETADDLVRAASAIIGPEKAELAWPEFAHLPEIVRKNIDELHQEDISISLWESLPNETREDLTPSQEEALYDLLYKAVEDEYKRQKAGETEEEAGAGEAETPRAPPSGESREPGGEGETGAGAEIEAQPKTEPVGVEAPSEEEMATFLAAMQEEAKAPSPKPKIGERLRTGKPGIFYIRVKGEGDQSVRWQPVEGRIIRPRNVVDPELRDSFFLHKANDGWSVSEVRSGLAITTGSATIAEARGELEGIFDRATVDQVKSAIEKGIATTGLAPPPIPAGGNTGTQTGEGRIARARKRVKGAKVRIDKEIEASLKELDDLLGPETLRAGIDPKILTATGKLLVRLAKRGVLDFADAVLAIAEWRPHYVARLAPFIERGWAALPGLGFQVNEPGSVADILKEAGYGESKRPGGLGPEGGETLEGVSAEDGKGDGGGGHAVRPPSGGREPRRGPVGGAGEEWPEHPGGERVGGEGVHPPAGGGSRDTGRGLHYLITDQDAETINRSGEKEKYKRNVRAIRTLKKIEAEGRKATPEEQAILTQFVGWGGVFHVFSGIHKDWQKEHEELRALLTEEEWKEARRSTPNAHYTSPAVVRGMWQGLVQAGFKGGKIAEPAIGAGFFYGLMPPELIDRSQLAGIEMDSIPARIASQLYQDADITHSPFQDVRLADGHFDLMISNVPFGNIKITDHTDSRLRRYRESLHNFYFIKAIKKTRPGGVVAFITSRYSMDAIDSGARRAMAEMGGDLIGAIRLPYTAFKGVAGTEVVTDILVFQKRAEGTPYGGEPFFQVGEHNGFPINEYFARHPENILGDLAWTGTMHPGRAAHGGKQMNVEPRAGQDLREEIAKIIGRMRERLQAGGLDDVQVKTLEMSRPPEPETRADFGSAREGNLTIRDGKLYQRQGDVLVHMNFPNGVKNAKARVEGQIAVREAARELMRVQITPDATDEQIAAARAELNRVYDDYVKSYGPLSSRLNRRAIERDVDAPMLWSLEHYDSDRNTAEKAAIFSERTQYPYVPKTHADTAEEALVASLAYYGAVDLDYMSGLTGFTSEKLTRDLAGRIYEDPETGRWQIAALYLSGNVRAKLKAAQEAAQKDARFEANVRALEAVQPKDLGPDMVTPRLGSVWVPTEYYEQFCREILKEKVSIDHIDSDGTWVVERQFGSVAATYASLYEYGIPEYDAIRILRAKLNCRPIIVREKKVIIQEKTATARAQGDRLERAFIDWLWQDHDRATKLLRDYNDRFNNFVDPRYDGSHLDFPGMSEWAKRIFRDYQRNAVWRIIASGNTALIHTVGAGKTWVGIAAAMEMRRLGIARKSIIVVPNHLVAQWGAEFMLLYPTARILVATKRDFEPARRMTLMNRIATGDWDAVIVPMTSFEKIPLSPERTTAYYQEAINDLEAKIHEAKARKGEKRDYIKQLEAEKQRLEDLLEKMGAAWKKDDGPFFDELGIDAMFVDEAHNFKNLWFRTKMTRLAGVPHSRTQRSFDMDMKVQYLNQTTGHRGVVMATGTPIANTVAEMWVLQHYLQPQVLKAHGIEAFDDWANLFGDTVNGVELDPAGANFRINTRFARFANEEQLGQMWREFADVLTAKDVKLPRPAVRGGKAEEIVSDATPELTEFIQQLSRRADAIRSGRVDPREDNMLKITSEGRAAALDMRLLDASAREDPNGKINRCVETVHEIWEQTKADRLTQLIWCDLGVPVKTGRKQAIRRSSFSVYDEIKRKLVERGVPAEEIAFVHDADTDDKTADLYKRFRAGRIRILMGSTSKLGTGANIQTKLYASHDLEPPQRPCDLEQRRGRIERFGNENKEIRIIRYITKGSFDAYLWQQLERKAAFIEQVIQGHGSGGEDIGDSALTFAELKAIATDNPRLMDYVRLNAEVKRLEAEEAGFRGAQLQLKREILSYENRIEFLERRAPEAREIARVIEEEEAKIPAGQDFDLEIDGIRYGKRKDAEKPLDEKMRAAQPGKADVRAGRINGLDLSFSAVETIDGVSHHATLWYGSTRLASVILGESPSGNITRILNMMAGLKDEPLRLAQQIEKNREIVEKIRGKHAGKFEKGEILDQKRRQLQEIMVELQMAKPGELLPSADDVIGDDEERPEGERQEEQAEERGGEGTSAMAAIATAAPWGEATGELRKAATAVAEAADDIRGVISPMTRGEQARATMEILRERTGRLAQKRIAARQKLESLRNAFERMPTDQQLDIIHRAETGAAQADPQIQAAMDLLQGMLQARWKQVLAVKGGEAHFIEHYFPHIWKDPRKAADAFAKFFGRRPLRGPASFLKKRKLPTVRDGIEMGLELVTTNPVDLTLLKIHEMDRYLMAHAVKQDLQAKGLLQFVYATSKGPDGWTKIDDRLFTVYAPPNIEVKEAYDEAVMTELAALAKKLGIRLERRVKIGGRHRWGYAEGDRLAVTKFGGPESVLMHEIGHNLDKMFDMWGFFGGDQLLRKNNVIGNEIRRLADMRRRADASESFRRYVRRKGEKMATVIQAYLYLRDEMKQIAPRTYERMEEFIREHPVLEDLKKIKPSLLLGENTAKMPVPGMRILGHYWAPEPAAKILNNYLSPGLQGRWWYEIIRKPANLLNQAQLGLSGFHAGFTTLDAMISKFALGLKRIVHLDPTGVFDLIKGVTPYAAVENVLRGQRLLQEYRKELDEIADPEMRAMVEAVVSAGGRVEMDAFYHNSAVEGFWRTWRQMRDRGVIGKGLSLLNMTLRAPGAIVEYLARPIMRHLVPRQKLGVFFDQARWELNRLGPEASHEEVRRKLQEIWDSVDNRLGQLVYDNLAWNRAFKDLSLISVRSVGWNLGTIRELGGAGKDVFTAIGRKWAGGRVLTERMYYAIALPILAGMYGALYQYLRTGEWPDEPKDYFFPKTGGTNPDGTAERVSIPSYMKDLYAWAKRPLVTATHKIHPILSAVAEMLRNEDFYGTQIRNANDPWVKQLQDLAIYAAGQFEPFSIRNMRQLRRTGETWAKAIQSFAGITPAPASLTRTKAMQMAIDYARAQMPAGRTQEQADRSMDRSQLINAGRKELLTTGRTDALERELVRRFREKIMSARMAGEIRRAVGESPLERYVTRLPAEQAMDVWEAATEKERTKKLGMIIRSKCWNAIHSRAPAEAAPVRERAQRLGLIR